MEAPRRARPTGLIEHSAIATAEVVRRTSTGWIAALGVGIVAVAWCADHVRLETRMAIAVSACYVTGVRLARSRRTVSWMADPCTIPGLVILATAWAGFVWTWNVDSWPLLLAMLGVAFHLGAGTRHPIAVPIAVVMAAVVIVPSVISALSDRTPIPRGEHLLTTWATVLSLIVIARRSRWGLVAAFAAAAYAWYAAAPWRILEFPSPARTDAIVEFAQSLVPALAWVFVPVFAGRVAAALHQGSRTEPRVDLGVVIQRHPWRTTLLSMALALQFLDANDPLIARGHLVTIAVMTCVGNLAAGWPSSTGSLAPWIAALALCAPLTVCSNWKTRYLTSEGLADAALLLYVPLVMGILSRARTVRFPWWGWMTVAAAGLVAAGQFAKAAANDGPWGAGREFTFLWCGTISLLLQALVTSGVSTPWVLLVCPSASLALAQPFRWATGMVLVGGDMDVVAGTLVCGLVAALLALGTRRVRSMCVLPEGHPARELASVAEPAAVA